MTTRWVAVLCGSLVKKQAEEPVVAEYSISLPKGKERYEGHDDHDRPRENLAATGAPHAACDLVPGLAMRETLDHVLEYAKYRYEDSKYQRFEKDRENELCPFIAPAKAERLPDQDHFGENQRLDHGRPVMEVADARLGEDKSSVLGEGGKYHRQVDRNHPEHAEFFDRLLF